MGEGLTAAEYAVLLGDDSEVTCVRLTLMEATARAVVLVREGQIDLRAKRRADATARVGPTSGKGLAPHLVAVADALRGEPVMALGDLVEIVSRSGRLTALVRQSLQERSYLQPERAAGATSSGAALGQRLTGQGMQQVRRARERVLHARRAADLAFDVESSDYAGEAAVEAVLDALGPAASLLFLDPGLLVTLHDLRRLDEAETGPARRIGSHPRLLPHQRSDPAILDLLVALDRLSPAVVEAIYVAVARLVSDEPLPTPSGSGRSRTRPSLRTRVEPRPQGSGQYWNGTPNQ